MTDILDRTKIYVDGAWIESTGSGRIDVLNPATEELIGTVAEGTVEDVDAAAKALARFECDTKHRDFKAFHHQQAIAFKKHLAEQDSQVTGGKLSGTKSPVADGDIADLAVVAAREGGKVSLYLVDLTGPGVTRETVESIDPTRGQSVLVFKDAPTELLGAAGEGWATIQAVYDRAAVLTAFEQVGGADRALDQIAATPGMFINVKDYGADPLAADNYAAIQAALDYAQSLGSATVYFPAGTYVVSATLAITDEIGRAHV